MIHQPGMKVTTPGDNQIVITRTFRAPRALVWDTMTKPDLIRKWLFGPPGWVMTTLEDDQRPGGAFRWAWCGPNGEELAMHGVNREFVPPHRIVRTETFDMGCDAQSGEQLSTLELTEQATRDAGVKTTLLTITLVYPSKEARDGAIASGMEHGMSAGYNRLDEILAGQTD